MTVFVDASVLVAVLLEEMNHKRYLAVLSDEKDLHTTDLALWEVQSSTFAALRRKRVCVKPNAVAAMVDKMLMQFAIKVEPFAPEDRARAFDAFVHYGRASGHPAALNMGDCFHYAVCRRIGARMLCTSPGEFQLTDLPCVA